MFAFQGFFLFSKTIKLSECFKIQGHFKASLELKAGTGKNIYKC